MTPWQKRTTALTRRMAEDMQVSNFATFRSATVTLPPIPPSRLVMLRGGQVSPIHADGLSGWSARPETSFTPDSAWTPADRDSDNSEV